jgi:hypothetical protein
MIFVLRISGPSPMTRVTGDSRRLALLAQPVLRILPMHKLSRWEIFYSFLIIVPMAAFMTVGDYILRKRATGD